MFNFTGVLENLLLEEDNIKTCNASIDPYQGAVGEGESVQRSSS